MEKETYNRLLNKRMNEIQEISKKIDSNNLVYYFKSNCSSKIDFIKFKGPYGLFRDTVINVVPNADISKTQNHNFFFNYIKNINFCIPVFCQDIFGCAAEPSSTKNWIF